jgi:ArsR family metal-binding transcriptional regulator
VVCIVIHEEKEISMANQKQKEELIQEIVELNDESLKSIIGGAGKPDPDARQDTHEVDVKRYTQQQTTHKYDVTQYTQQQATHKSDVEKLKKR